MQATEVTNQQYRDMAQWAYDNGYCAATSLSLCDAMDGSTQELLDLDDGDCQITSSDCVFSVEAGRNDHPVMEVTWYGSVAYCDWLSLQQGLACAYNHGTWQCNNHDPYNAQGYRLPTEAEWGYACRPHSSLGYKRPAPEAVRLPSLERVAKRWTWYNHWGQVNRRPAWGSGQEPALRRTGIKLSERSFTHRIFTEYQLSLRRRHHYPCFWFGVAP